MTGSANLDQSLTLLVGALANPKEPKFMLAHDRVVSEKVRMLEALLPSTWGDGADYVAALRQAIA